MTTESIADGLPIRTFTGQVDEITTDLGEADFVRLKDGDLSHIIERSLLPGDASFWQNLKGKRLAVTVAVREDR